MNHRLTPVVFALLALHAGRPAPAQEASKGPAKAEQKVEQKDGLTETRHSVIVGNSKLDYVATAGTLPLKDDEGKTTANVFFVAYTKAGVEDVAARPLTFAFNGGPGSSAVWLHLGAFGPRRVEVGDVGESVAPPYRLVPNESTLLDLTDLVFIDPVSTGYSRPAPGQNPKQFHGVQEDVHSVGEFIRVYVQRYGRWASPKFLAGESYGTTRAAGLADYLQERHGMNLNGVVLISSVLNFGTMRFDDGHDLPYALYLPSYTATAWYHKKLAPELQTNLRRTLDEVETFALGDYSAALMKGDRLSAQERKQIAGRVARYTGLSEEYVLANNLRVEATRFRKELLRKEHETVGRFDSRFKGSDADPAASVPEYDPSYSAVQGPYTAALNHYLRHELKADKEIPYEILSGRLSGWEYGPAKNRYLNVAGGLRQAMTKNRDLRVFVGNGYTDLATPYFATEYTFNHLGPEPAVSDRVTMTYYEAGHMMYVHKGALRQLKADLAAFYQAALRKPAAVTRAVVPVPPPAVAR